MLTDERYVKKRIHSARRLSLLFRLLHLFPVNKKKIVFSAFEGDGGFCCNPRYIAEELHRRDCDYKMVWLTRDVAKEFPDYIIPVKYSTWNIAFHLATAKVWVDNYRKPFGTLKRKKQLYIQTWHASFGFKAVGLFRGKAFPKIARLVSEWDSGLIDYMVSNSAYCDSVYPKKILYTGKTIRTGSPRVDCLINNKQALHDSLREKLSIEKKTKLLLFAPTFRGGNQKGKKSVTAEIPKIDFDRLVSVLQKKFGGTWYILLRLHPQLSAKMQEMPLAGKTDYLRDVSQFPDMSQILGGCDILITDYSSCAFDAAFAGIPVFLYADDVQEYKADRGEFMWKREELPFSTAETNETLVQNIRDYLESEYQNHVAQFMQKHEVLEDGHASERVVDVIEQYITEITISHCL